MAAALVLLAWSNSAPGASPQAECDFIAEVSTRWTGDAERIICDAPQAAFDRLIGWFPPHYQFETDVIAAALLATEAELRGPAARAGDEAARQRRIDIRDMITALENRNNAMYPGELPFGYQWRVLSGELQSVSEDRLIVPLRAVWQRWDDGRRPAQRAQDDARRLVQEVTGGGSGAPGVHPLARTLPDPPPDPVPIVPPPTPVEIPYGPIEYAHAGYGADHDAALYVLSPGQRPQNERQLACPAIFPRPIIDAVVVEALFEARRKSLASGAHHIEYGGFVLRAKDGERYAGFGGVMLIDGSRVFAARPARGEDGYIMARHKYCSLQRQGLARLVRPGSDTPQAEDCARGNRATRRAEENNEAPFGPLRAGLVVGLEVIASYHVHPKRQSGWIRPARDAFISYFSPGDLNTAKRQGLPEYVITPSCDVQLFEPPESWVELILPSCHFRAVEHHRVCDDGTAGDTLLQRRESRR